MRFNPKLKLEKDPFLGVLFSCVSNVGGGGGGGSVYYCGG